MTRFGLCAAKSLLFPSVHPTKMKNGCAFRPPQHISVFDLRHASNLRPLEASCLHQMLWVDFREDGWESCLREAEWRPGRVFDSVSVRENVLERGLWEEASGKRQWAEGLCPGGEAATPGPAACQALSSLRSLRTAASAPVPVTVPPLPLPADLSWEQNNPDSFRLSSWCLVPGCLITFTEFVSNSPRHLHQGDTLAEGNGNVTKATLKRRLRWRRSVTPPFTLLMIWSGFRGGVA